MSLCGALLQAVLTKKLRERITGPGAYEVRLLPHLHMMMRPVSPACICICDCLDHRGYPVSWSALRTYLAFTDRPSQTLNLYYTRAEPRAPTSGSGLVCRCLARRVHMSSSSQLHVLFMHIANSRKPTTVCYPRQSLTHAWAGRSVLSEKKTNGDLISAGRTKSKRRSIASAQTQSAEATSLEMQTPRLDHDYLIRGCCCIL